MNNLSRREKFLVGFLIALTIGIVFWMFIFTPLTNSIAEKRNTIASLQDTHSQMDQELTKEGTLDQTLEEAKEKAYEKLDYIFTTEDNEEISNHILQMALKVGANVTSLSVNDKQIADVNTAVDPNATPAAEGEEAITSYPLLDYLRMINADDEVEEAFDPNVMGNVYVYQHAIDITFKGTQQNYYDLIDMIKNQYSSMRIQATSITQQTKGGAPVASPTPTPTASSGFQEYTVDEYGTIIKKETVTKDGGVPSSTYVPQYTTNPYGQPMQKLDPNVKYTLDEATGMLVPIPTPTPSEEAKAAETETVYEVLVYIYSTEGK